jgi:hypothetical protein
MQKTLKQIFIWVVVITLFFNKYYNFNPFLSYPKVNNFVDLIVSPADLIVVTLGFWFFVITFFYNYLKPHTKYFVKPTISHLFVIVTLLTTFLIHPSYGILLIIARIFLLINIIPKLLHESNFQLRITLMVSLALSLLFDHFALSSSLPVLLLFILSLTLDSWQKKTLWVYLILNLVVAAYQIVKGQSLGLLYMGEPVISANSLNIARETVFGTNILRGYGLTQHPALLGFVAVFGLLFVYKNYHKHNSHPNVDAVNQKVKENKLLIFSSQQDKLLTFIPIAISLFSLSRTSVLTFIFNWIINTKNKLNTYPKILLLGGILGLFFYRFFTSDKYRILDLQTWFNVTVNMNILDVFLGLGYYPEFLNKYYEGLSIWQLQPTHNSVLGIFTQFGVWGSMGLLGWLYYDLVKPYFDNKKKKQQE